MWLFLFVSHDQHPHSFLFFFFFLDFSLLVVGEDRRVVCPLDDAVVF